MTKNNLREHLGWLIECGPCQPSQSIRTPPSAELAIALGPYLETQSLPQVSESIVEESTGVPSHVGDSQVDKIFARPALPASVLNAQSKDEMARLQSGPKSNNKPRMLSERIPLSLQTPVAASAPIPSTSLKDQYNAQWALRATGKSPGRVRHVQKAKT